MDYKEKALSSSTFCLLPFIHMATKTDGDLKLCCRSWPIGNISKQGIKSLWNSDTYKRVRMQMLNSQRPPECDACWRHEDIGVRSMRQRYNKSRSKQYLNTLDNLSDNYTMPLRIPIIEAKLSNFCNLKCRMCHPLDSTSWSKDWKAIEHLMKDANESTYKKVIEYDLTEKPYINAYENNNAFWSEFKEIAPFLDRIEFAGGEPLIDPVHYKILHILKDYGDNIEIKYSTNLTRLNYKKDDVEVLWNYFKCIDLNISIDGIYDVYNYIRQLGDYDIVKENIKKISNHKKLRYIGAAITLQIYNSFQIPAMFDEFVEECNIDIHTHRVNYPKFLDARVIPQDLRNSIIKDLEKYIHTVLQKTHKNWTKERKNKAISHLEDAIAMFKGGDMSAQINNFIEFSDTLDKKQEVKKTWRELLPVLSKGINKNDHN